MTGPLRRAVEAVAGELGAAGILATLDARQLNPPGALLVPLEHEPTMAAGIVRVRVYLVAPNVGTLDALDVLDELAGAAETVGVATTGPMLVESVTVAGVASGDPLPAYTYTVDVHTE